MRGTNNGITHSVKILQCAFCVLAMVTAVYGATPKVTTVAGGYIGNGKPAVSAGLARPQGVAIDTKGNIYVSDTDNCQIRKIGTNGKITVLAGTGICGFSGDGGPAKSATISFPYGVAFDHNGDLLFVDYGNNRIRKITTKGTISTIAGNGNYGYTGDGGPALQATIGYPVAISADPAGNFYIADQSNQVIRMVDTAGVIHTVAGNGTSGFSGDNGLATSAQLRRPDGMLADGNGNLYISDGGNQRIRKVDSNGIITTYAGTGSTGNEGNGGPATQAEIGEPQQLVLAEGSLYFSTGTNVWTVNLNTQIANIVVGPVQQAFGFNGDGMPALSTLFLGANGIAFDASGNLIIADQGNNRIRKVNAAQTVSTIAGGSVGDGGKATASSLSMQDFFSGHLGSDPAGNLYIADTYNNRVRKVSPAKIITTVAGTGVTGFTGDNGPASEATLKFPNGVAADAFGNVYIADGNNVIRKVDNTGTITTFAFIPAEGLAVDAAGNVYAADFNDCVVWQITPAGAAHVIAGVMDECGYNGDGIESLHAWLWAPSGVAVDKAGNVYIADYDNARIRKVDASFTISTVAGNGIFGFGGDGGPATAAMINFPTDVAVDDKGNLYIADSINQRIRVVDSEGTIDTFAGSGSAGYNGNNLPATAANVYPSAVTVNSKNVVYVTDIACQQVRKIH